MKFKTVNTSTRKGLKEAEKLQMDGWIICSVGTETIQFSKGESNKH